MGKLKNNKRFKLRRPGPLSGFPQDLEVEQVEDSKYKSIIENIEMKMQLPNPNEKISGLQILTGVLDEPSIFKELVESKVIKLIAPCLVDSCSSLRNVAAATLRNLSDHDEISNTLIDKDVMTPLLAYIHTYGEDLKPDKKDLKVSENSDTFLHVINLLLNLCETSSVAVKYFNSENLVAFLFRFLDPNKYRIELVVSIAQCLLTASEGNKNVVKFLETEKNTIIGLIDEKSEDPAQVLLRTLIIGLLCNISGDDSARYDKGSFLHCISILSSTLALDVRMLVHDLTSQIPLEGNLSNEEYAKLISVSSTLDAQLTAVEILTNVLTLEDEEYMEEDGYESCSESEVSENEGFSVSCFNLPPQVQELIASVELVPKLLSKVQLPAENVCDILSSNKDYQQLLQKLKLLQSRALFCFNNLVSVLDVTSLGGAEKLFSLWSVIGQEVFKSFEVREEEFLEAASSAMRAILLKLAEMKYSNVVNFSTSDLEVLFNTARNCPYDSIRAILIRNIATLGSFFINSEQSTVLDAVGVFLLDMCNNTNEVWIIAEAIDGLMDLYSEDETDGSAARINLVQRLQTGAPVFKTMIRSKKASLGEHLPLVNTVQLNLNRFIKYKSNRLKQLSVI